MKFKFKKILIGIWLSVILVNTFLYFNDFYFSNEIKAEVNQTNYIFNLSQNNKRDDLILEKMTSSSSDDVTNITNIDNELLQRELEEKNKEFERLNNESE